MTSHLWYTFKIFAKFFCWLSISCRFSQFDGKIKKTNLDIDQINHWKAWGWPWDSNPWLQEVKKDGRNRWIYWATLGLWANQVWLTQAFKIFLFQSDLDYIQVLTEPSYFLTRMRGSTYHGDFFRNTLISGSGSCIAWSGCQTSSPHWTLSSSKQTCW